MDPYLEDEALWPAFQHQLVLALYQVLLPGLVDRFRARIGTRHYVTEQPLFTSVLRQEHHEEYIEIRLRADGRLVTLLDIASPTNRTTPRGRLEYLNQRQAARNVGANLVEIDLVLQGKPLLDYPRENLGDWDHAVTLTRSINPEKHEVYTATLQKPLPRFKLPLGRNDRDLIVDLSSVFARAFDQGNFTERIDYKRDPRTTLDDTDRAWIGQLLGAANLREA
jgi:hypothetical protein